MSEPVINYDELSDTLYISFSPGELATGIELNEHILLRLNKAAGRVVGLTFLDYSLLAQQTEVGPRSFPLTGLADLSPALRELILQILHRQEVRQFLSITAYSPSPTETIPAASLLPISTGVAST